MSISNNTVPPVPATSRTNQFSIETIARKPFSRCLQDLLRTDRPAGAIRADVEYDDVYLVEVFNAPGGMFVAVHELDEVHIVRPVLMSTGKSVMTPEPAE